MLQNFYKTIRISAILALVPCSYINPLLAQGEINIRAGLNNSWLYDIGSSDEYRYGEPEFDHKQAYYLGFSYYKPNNKRIRLESDINICSKFASIYASSGGIGSYTTIDAEYSLYYADISVYPAVTFGDKLNFIASIRPNIGLMFASSRSGEESYWAMSDEPYTNTFSTSPVSGDGKEEFAVISFDVAFNVRLERALTEKSAILIECQYSKGLNNISKLNEFKYNFNNVLVGTGIVLRL